MHQKHGCWKKLLVLERKILRRIFGPTEQNQTWRINSNEELDKLIKHEDIVNYTNLLMPNINYIGRTAPLTSKVAFYIFIQQI